MIKEEALERVERYLTDYFPLEDSDKIDEIIKALEQEPTIKDCISRAEAIKGLGEQPYVWTDSDFEIQQLADWKIHKEMLENLPSVTPIRPKGHWIMTNDYLTTAYGSIDYVKCSCCGEDSLEEGNYCPNCGSDNREVKV